MKETVPIKHRISTTVSYQILCQARIYPEFICRFLSSNDSSLGSHVIFCLKNSPPKSMEQNDRCVFSLADCTDSLQLTYCWWMKFRTSSRCSVHAFISLFTMGIIWYKYILSTVKAGFQGSKCQCALLLGRRTHQSSASNDKGKLQNSCEDSDEAGTAPPNVEILAQPAAVHDICNLSISKRHDIPLLEPRAQVLQSQHGWWTQKDGSNTPADAIQVSYHGAALPCRRMVPWVYSGWTTSAGI